jgi:hypothetical protein
MANEAEIYSTAMSGYQIAIQEESVAYQRAQATGDLAEAVRASQSIAALRSQANEFHNMAQQQATAMAPARPVSKFGLSEAERELAHTSIVDRRDMRSLSDEEKEKVYAENKARLHRMRASGEYRQTTDQG